MILQPTRPEKNLFSIFTNRTLFEALLAIVFLAGFSTFTFGQSPEIRKAVRYIDSGQPSKGLQALEQMVSSNPGNSTFLYYLGLAQIRTGAKDKALATFEKGIAANGKDGLNYAGKGYVRLLEKNPTDAKIQMDKALQVSRSKDVGILKAVAEAYLTDTKYLLDAFNALNKAKEINSSDPEIHMLLGDALLLQNVQNAGPTVSAYEAAAKADPKLARPHYKIGKIYQKARSNDNAIAAYEKAIAVDAEYAPAYSELADIYYVDKKADKAVEVYEKYLPLTEDKEQAKFKYAFFLFMAKKFDKANEIFKEVVTNPNVPIVAFRYYAYSLTEEEKTDEARQMFKRYFEKARPEDIQALDYAYFGRLHILIKTPEGDSLANEAFTNSLTLDSTQAEILQLHGDAYMRREKFSEAIKAFKQLMAIRRQPLSQDLWSIGRAYYANEQFNEADSAFTKLTEKQPNMTVGPLYAARSRANIDSSMSEGLAKSMYEMVLERAMTDPKKNKKEIIESYEYFGVHAIKIEKDVNTAISYFEKILALDPSNKQAQFFMNELEK
jgi:tetratricopeptide (TPR) repeat protein